MADRCYFTLTEKASVNKHQMSSNMKSTPWIPCPINQVFLSRSTVVCFGQCAKQECLLSVDYNVMQTKPQTSLIKALTLLNPLLNQWSVACKSRATHLGLETLENRCHHLPDFLCTDKKKVNSVSALCRFCTHSTCLPVPVRHKHKKEHVNGFSPQLPSHCTCAAGELRRNGVWVLVVKPEEFEWACFKSGAFH